ncbi:methionyl-tRNA formyltransferase [Halorubrum lacusprofundi]|jgi:methionyl-tRNA formyltransferase|uniref:Methionyl-tRNA formyltransferase n=1 Tax=Halorubrum lacusprofundi TaxID=2247 RepID=A0A220SXP3_9EURY|nr:formyltransferase family protein [Halorubrum lacusprofundi]ASK38200.1 Methionyl-tRNA formyltransferase [Halorubrum lacusprofundi]
MVDIVFLGLNDIGERLYEWLVARDDANVQALITEADQLSIVRELEPELLIAGGFRYIVPPEILEIPDRGSVNLHKAYLPFNRGANPNVWSIQEDTPAGVTIHYMTEDLDSGPIIDRREVDKRPDDDAKDLYQRLETAQFEQFVEVWPDIRDGTVDGQPQEFESRGTYHTKEDFVELWELDLERETTVGAVIDKLRALTFPPFKNAYFKVNDNRYFIDISITKAEQSKSNNERRIPKYTEDEQP